MGDHPYGEWAMSTDADGRPYYPSLHAAQAHQQQQVADARQNLNQLAGPSTAGTAHPGAGRLLHPPHSHPSAPTSTTAAGSGGPSHLRPGALPLPSPLYPLAPQQNGNGGGGGGSSAGSSSSNDGAPVWGMQWQQPPPQPSHPQHSQHAHYQPPPHQQQHQRQMYASPPTASSSSLPMYGHPPPSLRAGYRHVRPMHPPPVPPPPPSDGSYSPAQFPPSLPSSSARPGDDYRASAPPMASPSLRPPTADYLAASVSSSPHGSPGTTTHALHARSSSLVSPQPAYPSPLNPYHPPPASASSGTSSLRPPAPPVRSISTPVLPPARILAPPSAFSAPPPPPPPLAGPEGAYYTFGSSGLVQADDESDSGFEPVDAPSGAGGKRALRTKVAAQKAVQDEEEKQARRREQNRAAQRAYKARQNKHVEEVEIHNKELALKLRQQRDELQNLRDLLQRCQRENDILKQHLHPVLMARDADAGSTSPDSWTSFSTLAPSVAAPSRPASNPNALKTPADGLQDIINGFAIRPALPPAQRTMPADEVRRANELAHAEHLRKRYESYRTHAPGGSRGPALLGLMGVNTVASSTVDHDGGSAAVLQVPEPTLDSPINEDNLQDLLGPRYWEYGTRLVPAPPRVPLRGIWREVKAAVPAVQRDDIDVDSLCAALRRSAFCDGVEACIPTPAFHYIVESIIQPAVASAGTSTGATTSPIGGGDS